MGNTVVISCRSFTSLGCCLAERCILIRTFHFLFQFHSRQISVFFANGSKVKVTLSTTQTTSDLLEMSEIKEHLNSSTAHIVLVDNVGKGQYSNSGVMGSR